MKQGVHDQIDAKLGKSLAETEEEMMGDFTSTEDSLAMFETMYSDIMTEEDYVILRGRMPEIGNIGVEYQKIFDIH